MRFPFDSVSILAEKFNLSPGEFSLHKIEKVEEELDELVEDEVGRLGDVVKELESLQTVEDSREVYFILVRKKLSYDSAKLLCEMGESMGTV